MLKRAKRLAGRRRVLSRWMLGLFALLAIDVASPVIAQKGSRTRALSQAPSSSMNASAPFFSVRAEQKISSLKGGFPIPIPAQSRFGWACAVLGDLDEDGVPDIAVSSLHMNDDRGAVWVLFLNSDGTVKRSQAIGHGVGGFSGTLIAPATFGRSITSIGDVNGDGIPDLAVGSTHNFSIAVTLNSALWILFLNRDGTVLFDQEISVLRRAPGGSRGPNRRRGVSAGRPRW